MQPKKTPKADLKNKRGIFFQIGLIVSLFASILFFMSSQPAVSAPELVALPGIDDFDLPPVVLDKPEQPKPVQPVSVVSIIEYLNIVPNDRKIDTDFNFAEGFDDTFEFVPASGKPEEVIEDPIDIHFIENQPLFRGQDVTAFRAWVMQNLKYPALASQNNISGRVTVQFVIDRHGKLSNIEILGSPHSSLAEETIRILTSSPEEWTPGRQGGRAVAVRYVIPVEFRLQ